MERCDKTTLVRDWGLRKEQPCQRKLRTCDEDRHRRTQGGTAQASAVLMGYARVLVKLHRRDALGAARQEVHGDDPLPERDLAALHRRLCLDREVAPTVCAAQYGIGLPLGTWCSWNRSAALLSRGPSNRSRAAASSGNLSKNARTLGPYFLEHRADSPSGFSKGLAQGDERSEELTGAAVAFFEVGAAEPRDETGVAILVGNV